MNIYNKSAFNIVSRIRSGQDPSLFIEATFTMYEGTNTTPFLTKTLTGGGITVSDDSFVISVEDDDITITGAVYMQLVLTNSEGENLPPLFTRNATIREVR